MGYYEWELREAKYVLANQEVSHDRRLKPDRLLPGIACWRYSFNETPDAWLYAIAPEEFTASDIESAIREDHGGDWGIVIERIIP
jgi:hypothetical protein